MADLTYSAEALYRSGIVYAEQLSAPNEALETYNTWLLQRPSKHPASDDGKFPIR